MEGVLLYVLLPLLVGVGVGLALVRGRRSRRSACCPQEEEETVPILSGSSSSGGADSEVEPPSSGCSEGNPDVSGDGCTAEQEEEEWVELDENGTETSSR